MPSGVYVHPVSIAVNVATEFVDHYAIMELDSWATSEEIKNAYRQLRGKYFGTDIAKYRALQSAFDILVDKEAKWKYDKMYREMKGFPAPPPLKDANTEIQSKVVEIEEGDERPKDNNAQLKKHVPMGKSVLGLRPYPSFIPILEAYAGRATHPELICSRPKYVLSIAKNATPI